MGHLLVPLEATQTAATVWVGVVGRAPGTLSLDGGGADRSIDGGWREWQTHGVPRLWSQRKPGHVVLTGVYGVRQPSAAIPLPDDPRLTVSP